MSRKSVLSDLHRICLKSRGKIVLLVRDIDYGLAIQDLAEHVYDIFEGRDSTFPAGIGLYPVGGAHRRKTLGLLRSIPKGKVTTYGEIAKLLDIHPRSVANYVAANPFPLIIPCHRVVRSDLKLGEYSCGQIIKGNLLIREGVGVDMDTGKLGGSSVLTSEELRELLLLRARPLR